MIKLRETLDWCLHYRAQRKTWAEASTVPELGERGARWCRGELGAHPMGYDVPALETTDLLPVLERVNAAGFFTFGSQPGGQWEEGGHVIEQRAFVEGYLERDRLEEFRRHVEGAGMVVMDSISDDTALTLEDGVVVTGGKVVNRVHGLMAHISRDASRALAHAAELSVVDLEWHRNDALWAALDGWAAAQ